VAVKVDTVADAMCEMRSRTKEIDEQIAVLSTEQSRSSDDIARLQSQEPFFCTGVSGGG